MGRFLRAWWKCEDGSATIEAVLWTPIFLILFGMITDTSIVFGREAEILRVIQDSNRSLAVGHFQTVQEAQTYISGKIKAYSSHSTIKITIVKGIISTSVSLPAADLTATKLFDAIDTLTVTVGASQMSEL